MGKDVKKEETQNKEHEAIQKAKLAIRKWRLAPVLLGTSCIEKALVFLYKYGATEETFDDFYKDAISSAYATVVNKKYYDDTKKHIVETLEDVEQVIKIALRGSDVPNLNAYEFLKKNL